MADFDASSIDDDLNARGAGIRWLATVLLLLGMAGVTVVALHWYQPIREFLDSYLGVEPVPEESLEPEGSLTQYQEALEPSDFTQSEETSAPDGTDQTSGGFAGLLDVQDVGVPISISARDFASARDPIETVRFELQIALLAIGGNGDLLLASDALRHAQSIATTNRLNPTFIGTVDQALAEIDYLSKLDLETIEDGLKAVSTRIALLKSVESEYQAVTDTEPESTFEVSEQSETQGFWGELGDGISSVYEIRRIDETNPVDNSVRIEAGAQVRALLSVERARRDMRTFDFESYREALNEAHAIVDSLSHADTEELSSIRDQLHELVTLELTSPYGTIRSAIEVLTDEASTHRIEAGVAEP